MPLTELTSVLGTKRAAHLLRRTCFGGSFSEIDDFAQLTPAQAVQRLFDTDLPDPGFPIDPLTGSEWITTGNSQSEGFELERYFLCWHLGQYLANGVEAGKKLPYIFRERLVFFLHSHFTTKKSVVGDTRALFYQQALFRLFAFDEADLTIPSGDPMVPDTVATRNFKQLTKKICTDNAMLIFLDGRLNVKGSPNENFTRELLELYTIGRGLEGNIPEPEFEGDYYHFTEEDVQAGAKVLSGFNSDDTFSNIDIETNLPRGVIRGGSIASSHETGNKTLSARMGNGEVVPDSTLMPTGNHSELSVLDEVSQFIDLIFNQPETARAICKEIYRFFVYHQIDQTLYESTIQDMAETFIANEFKLQPVLVALLTSEHFYEAEVGIENNNFGCIIKSPLDLVIGFRRNFNLSLPDYPSDLDRYYIYTNAILSELNLQGMDYYEPFEVAGYPAYHQFPIFNRSWITTNYLTNRYNFIRKSIVSTVNPEMGQVAIYDFVKSTVDDSIAQNPRDLIISLAQYLLPYAENLTFDTSSESELTTERLHFFLAAFLYSPQIDLDPESEWTSRWQTGNELDVVKDQLAKLVNAMLQTPEYQLM